VAAVQPELGSQAQDLLAEAPPDPDTSLLSPEMGARLHRLTLLARRLPLAKQRGRRRTRVIGQGTERIDTREYAVGDDPRRIAWTIYGRLERLLTWLVAEEAPLRLALVVDSSGSMGFGRPTKLVQAARLAAGLTAVALAGEDRVAALSTSGRPDEALRSMMGRRTLPRFLAMLDKLEAGGPTDLARAATTATACAGGRGLCVILSDFFDPQGAMSGAQALRDRGHDVALIQVLDPFEIDPPELGGVVLEDEETGELVELPDSGARAAYLQALADHYQQLEDQAAEMGAPVMRVTTQEPFDALVAQALTSGFMRAGTLS
jgi:uncharacterized protein (DUF58 family)